MNNQVIRESQEVENCRFWTKKIQKIACGFANVNDGVINIGINHEGDAVGLSENGIEKRMEKFRISIYQKLGIIPKLRIINNDKEIYIEIAIKKSSYPVRLHGKVFKRSDTTTYELQGLELQKFNKNNKEVPWVNQIQEDATLDDIDLETIEMFKKSVSKSKRIANINSMNLEEFLINLELYSNEGMTKAALILFGNNGNKYFCSSDIEIKQFGIDTNNLLFFVACRENLIKNYFKVLDLLKSHYLVNSNNQNFPKSAFNEVILNALIHRDYFVQDPIKISVFQDRMNVWNPGTLEKGITFSKLFDNHYTKPRNQLISDVCFKAGYVEKIGNGLDIMTKACISAQYPQPKFKVDNLGITVITKFSH